MPPDPGQVTFLLNRIKAGDRDVMSRLIEIIYDELRHIAKLRIKMEVAGHTLSPTALVHEAYLRLAKSEDLRFENRSHFLAVAATAMRRILVDHARAREALKRGGRDIARPHIEELQIPAPAPDSHLIRLDEALQRLAEVSPRQCQVVELRYFVGLQDEEVAAILNVTTRTVSRDWRHARAWLHSEIKQ